MSEENLAVIRAAIDEIDEQMVDLIAQREKWVRAAGAAKAGRGEQAVKAPARVEAVLALALTRAEAAGASPAVVEATYRAMITAFTGLELQVSSDVIH